MIIDSHAHMDELETLGWIDPPEKVISLMDEAGIDMAVVSTYCNLPGINPNALEYVAEAVSNFPERLIPYVRLDPWYGEKTLEIMEIAVKEFNFKGIKLHPVHYTLHPFGEATLKLLRKAAELDIPVLLHCSDEAMSLPLQIGLAAEKVPEATLIMAHSGGFYHTRDAMNVAKKHRNVYLDTCEMTYPQKIKEAAEMIGADKILFGTDLPTDNARLEIEKIKLAGLAPEEQDMVFYKNISRILKLNL